MVNEPYFNEPGYEATRGTPSGTTESQKYNRNLYAHTLQYAVLEMLEHGQERYPEFYPIIQRHFAYHQDFLLKKMEEWHVASPQTVSHLIPRVQSALAGLPPLRTRKRAARKAAPETISLVDEEDDGAPRQTNSGSTSVPNVGAQIEPETILLD